MPSDDPTSNPPHIEGDVPQSGTRFGDGATPAVTPTGTFASLKVPAYKLLFWSAIISSASILGQSIARAWLANEITGSNAGLGGVLFAFGISMLVLNPVGGVAADRFSRRSILIGTQIVLMFTSLWIGLAISFDFLTYGQLLATSAIQAAVFAFLGPARMAMTAEVVGQELLPNAIVLGQMSFNSTRVIGPSLVGWAIGVAWIGSAGVHYAATAFAVLATWQVARLPNPGKISVHAGASPIEQFRDGIRYARQHREVRLLLITSFAVVMIAFPFQAFLAQVATDTYGRGSGAFGLLQAFTAIGAVAVSFAIARIARNELAWDIQTWAGFGFGVGLLLLAWAPYFWTALGAAIVLGAASSGFTSMNNTLTLTLSDYEYHGRLQSLMMLSFSGFGMAALPLGALADAIGLRETFGLMGLVTIASMTVSFLRRSRWPKEQPNLA